MKIFKCVIFVALTVAFFGGCQKELNFNGDSSHGSLKSAITGDCNPITINGFYQADSTLTSDNWVEVQVNTNFAGNFEIKSDTVNGFSFDRTGYIPTGLNTIRLLASGKPDSAMSTTFKVYYDTTHCSFTINVVASTVGAAHYVLGGSPGACASFTPHGTYTVGTALDASDSITFLVNVTNPGTYSITTGALVNGMKFTGSGSFANTGIYQVSLYGSGTPTSNSTASFSPTGDGTTCTFSITPGGGAGSASFSFNGGPTPGTCSGAIVHGPYTAGTTVTSSNTVDVFVTVTAVGTYGITTAPINGITFSKTGTFTSLTPNPQMVTLTASGTPTAPGTYNFTPTSTATSCVFSVTFVGGSTNADYIPQTVGSNWTDSLVGGTVADTSYTEVSPRTTVQAANTYQVFTKNSGGVLDSTYHRKGSGSYYEYFYGTLGFDNPINKEVLLLDSTKNAGYTWTVNLGSNSIGGGAINVIAIKIDAQLLAKGTTQTIVGTTYTNVAKVLFKYYADIGGGFQEIADEEFWYAKGFGLIYDKQTNVQGGGTVTEYVTKRIQIF